MPTEITELLSRARNGQVGAIGRLVSIVENDGVAAAEIAGVTYADSGRAIVVGITGPPGAGKSTLVSRLIESYRSRYPRVAVVAVDPSSPFTSGAILGDRIRMRERFLDSGVFIRSMASRGHQGGLARTTKRVVDTLDGIGFDVILVETVGVGQEEIEIIRVVDTVCLVTVPGTGDDVQALKSGVMEIADILVVNKADRPGADQTVKDLAQALTLGPSRLVWKVPIVKTSATDDTGVGDLTDAIDSHRAWAIGSGDLQRRKVEAIRSEVELLMRERVMKDLEIRLRDARFDEIIAHVVDRTLDPTAAADQLLH